jgi:hypothetical protein
MDSAESVKVMYTLHCKCWLMIRFFSLPFFCRFFIYRHSFQLEILYVIYCQLKLLSKRVESSILLLANKCFGMIDLLEFDNLILKVTCP